MALHENEDSNNASIFVRKVPFDVTSASFSSFFSEIAPIKHAMIVTDPETKQSKGYGFVSFLTHSDAEKAISELKKKKFSGYTLKAEFAKRRHRNMDDNIQKEITETKKRMMRPFLIIRNLPWSVRKKDDAFFLKFSEYGKVINVIIPRKKGGKMSGFAFVHMKKRSEAENAMNNINGLELNGRNIAVDWALSQSEWKKFLEEKIHENKSIDNESQVFENKDIISEIDNKSDSHEDIIIKKNKKDLNILDKNIENTLFIRNLSFETTDDVLFSHFYRFGPLKYCRIVVDTFTGKSKGTAFVCFLHKTDMENCVKLYKKLSQSKLSIKEGSSILQNEIIDDNTKEFVVDGRLLSIFPALNKEEISIVENNNKKERKYMLGKNLDKRNIFLLNEGYIDPKSPMYELLNQADRNMRNQSFSQRKKQLEKNPSLYISLTRLSIRNIPKGISDKDLKALAREACVNFAKEVKENKRMPLTQEEKHRDGNPKKGKKGIVRQAKIIEEKNGRKLSYGFIEYIGHRWALMGLRWLNGRKISSKKDENVKKRLIVEFALENINVVKRRQERENKQKINLKVEDNKSVEPFEKKRKRDSSLDSTELENKKETCISYIMSRKRRKRKAQKEK